MAQAQVVLTAVDRTQVAINSALRGMKSIERVAKVTARTVNLAFGFLTGGLIISSFQKITEAAKKTEEGQRALLELNRALKDPALISAAEAFTNALVVGFAKAIQQAARFIKFVRSELIAFGALGPGGTAADAASIIRGQIANKTMLAGQFAMAGPSGVKSVEIINSEIAALRNQLTLVDGLASAEAKADAERIDALIREEALFKTLQEVKITSTRKTTGAMESLLASFEERNRTSIQKTASEFYKAQAEIEASTVSAEEKSRRLSEILDEILPGVEVTGERFVPKFKQATDQMQEFAKAAAENIQSSFADFLFDPFKDGLKGMLAGFLNFIRRAIAEAAAATILQSLFGGFVGKGGFLGALAGALIPRAMGGSVSAGTPYLVGERGPEMFVPGTSGNIVPNNKMGGVTVSPVYNIDARGASADLQDALPGILAENNRRIFDELDRRYGIGR
jgi:hypothetical protein